MNQKVDNKMVIKLPKHIDPRERVENQVTTEIINMTFMMKDSGSTPYRYIRRAFLCLASGKYGIACDWLTYAEKFVNVFWPEGSTENEALKLTINTQRIQFLFLVEKFQELKIDPSEEE